MDAVELPLPRGAVPVSKILSVKGFCRERISVGEAGNHETTTVPVSGSSAIAGCSTARCSKDKSRVVKQKNGLDGKRGDKKSLKAPMKTKMDAFFSKNGVSCSNSSSGGHNVLGIYGLKSDIHAVTKHVDELSLNELLDGSYNCPSLCKDKGRKAANTNESILHTVRKACSFLQFQRTVPSQKDVEQNSESQKTETRLLDSDSCLASTSDLDKGDNNMTPKASPCKIDDSRSKLGTPASLEASLLHQPRDILERLALQPAKDLNSFLLDTAKPAVPSRITPVQWVGKPIAHRDSLLPFSWSRSFTGSNKTNMDASKLTNRSTGQGRWLRIESTACSQGDDACCFSDLELFAADQNLFSLKQLNLNLSEQETTQRPVRPPWTEQVSLSSVTCNLDSHFIDQSILNGSGVRISHHPFKHGLLHKSDNYSNSQLRFGFNMGIVHNSTNTKGNLKFGENDVISVSPLPNNLLFQENEDYSIEEEPCKRRKNAGSGDGSCYSLFHSAAGRNNLESHLHELETSKLDGYSPRLLAAAQILHQIARLSSFQNQSSAKIRWPKKLSQKAMKARKSRSPLRKTEVIAVAPKPVTNPSDDHMNPDQRAVPSKKPRFFMPNNQRRNIAQTSNFESGQMKFPVPTTSSRSSPPSSRLEKGLVSVSDTKKLNSDTLKLLGMMPPSSSTRGFDKACNSQQKLRKPLFIDWSRGRGKKE